MRRMIIRSLSNSGVVQAIALDVARVRAEQELSAARALAAAYYIDNAVIENAR